jgi:hypothetical protein
MSWSRCRIGFGAGLLLFGKFTFISPNAIAPTTFLTTPAKFSGVGCSPAFHYQYKIWLPDTIDQIQDSVQLHY